MRTIVRSKNQERVFGNAQGFQFIHDVTYIAIDSSHHGCKSGPWIGLRLVTGNNHFWAIIPSRRSNMWGLLSKLCTVVLKYLVFRHCQFCVGHH